MYLCHQQACYFNKFDFQVFFFTVAVENNCGCFIYLKIFDNFSSAKSCFKFF